MWPIQLRDPLPTIAIPLLPGDADARLHLQDLLNATYDQGGYANYIYDNESTTGPTDAMLICDWAEDLTWHSQDPRCDCPEGASRPPLRDSTSNVLGRAGGSSRQFSSTKRRACRQGFLDLAGVLPTCFGEFRTTSATATTNLGCRLDAIRSAESL